MSAFQPSASYKRTIHSKWNMAATKEFAGGLPGSSEPLEAFDPLDLSLGEDLTVLKRYQEAELKHGRICMLAAPGILIAEGFHPFYDGKITGPAIYHFQKILNSSGPEFMYFSK